MKYIIDVPDKVVEFMDGEMSFFIKPKIKNGQRIYYMLQIDEEDVSIYTELDHKAIEDEVWEFVKEIILKDNGTQMSGMFENELNECFGYPYYSDMFANLSYKEAKSKYEVWLKQKDEIRVGDEIGNGFVKGTAFFVDETIVEGFVIDDNEKIEHFWWNKRGCKKTGRHFPEVAELLKKMKGGEE